ncbi:MAG: patatin-like phospholipase family protein [Vicinamibacterales bacterium]
MNTTEVYGSHPQGASGPKRSLVLSGGGMRVSYQAGVIKALMEAGLRFFHGDGTSGGGMSLAMLFSGLTPDEMCDRWRSLRVKDFVAFMPLEQYLRAGGPVALGSTRGIVEKVFPHLGIDIGRITRATGMRGTFNVCNYTRKVNEVFRHDQVDIDLIVAGMSLPIFMPPLQRGPYLYTDSAWIRDANPLEAARQGADEIWIVWTLGNSTTYRGGPFQQYIQMLEMSANGALFEDFDRIADINRRIEAGEAVYGRTTPIRVHVIAPKHPLPLDPDLYFGRIDSATLIDMGYRDARRYLAERREEGVPLTPEATAMTDTPVGISFRETMSGPFALGETDPKAGEAAGKRAGTELSMHASVEVSDLDGFVEDATHTGSITGRVDFKPFAMQMPADRGVFRLFSPTDRPNMRHMVYELAFQHQGEDYYLAGSKEVQNDHHGTDLWKDTTTLFTRLHRGTDATGPVIGAGVLRLGIPDLAKLTSTIRVTNATGAGERLKALSTFGRFFMGSLWDTYGPKG